MGGGGGGGNDVQGCLQNARPPCLCPHSNELVMGACSWSWSQTMCWPTRTDDMCPPAPSLPPPSSPPHTPHPRPLLCAAVRLRVGPVSHHRARRVRVRPVRALALPTGPPPATHSPRHPPRGGAAPVGGRVPAHAGQLRRRAAERGRGAALWAALRGAPVPGKQRAAGVRAAAGAPH